MAALLLQLLLGACLISFGKARPITPVPLDDFYDEISYLIRQHQENKKQLAFPQPVEVPNWPKKNLALGQVTAIDVDKEGHVVAFHRGSHVWDDKSFDAAGRYRLRAKGPIPNDTIVILDDETGKLLDSWGPNKFYLPHGLTVDRKGNYWLTDVALHQVFKFRPGSIEPSLVLGEAFVPGKDDRHFCKPTDVAVASTGEFFVSDGYCNSRILKYSPRGVLLVEWGHAGGRDEFSIPHSLTLLEEQDMLCVADRENERIVCYSAGLRNLPAGRLLVQIKNKQLGPVYGIVAKDNIIYAVARSSSRYPPTGMTIDLQTQEILGTWSPAEGFQVPHDVAVSSDGNELYVAEIEPNRITKFNIKRQ